MSAGGIEHLVISGPLLLAIPVAAAAGALTFLSPCVLPLVPGYLSYITGMSGAAAETSAAGPAPAMAGAAPAGAVTDNPAAMPGATATITTAIGPSAAGSGLTAVQPPGQPRVLAGTALFVLGFSALFATYGGAFGAVGQVLHHHEVILARVLGCMIIVMGLLFIGAFDKFAFTGRILRPSFRPRAGLAGAPLLGVLFGLGWAPCIGPTLSAVLTLGLGTGAPARGALLAFVYGLGIGIPFMIVAVAFQRGVSVFGFARRRARLITIVGGVMLITVGLLEVTGAWSSAVVWLQLHWTGYTSPI